MDELERRIKGGFVRVELEYIEQTESTFHPETGVEMRDIPGMKGLYKAGADGEIYSFCKSSRNPCGNGGVPFKMSLRPDEAGGPTVGIGGRRFKARQLAALAWGRQLVSAGGSVDRKNAKLSPGQVNEVKILLENGLSTRLIAKQFNVSQPVISYIHTGKRKGTNSPRKNFPAAQPAK